MASKLIVFPFLFDMGSSLGERVDYVDTVAMPKPMKFDVKINSKTKESQDNANRVSKFIKTD